MYIKTQRLRQFRHISRQDKESNFKMKVQEKSPTGTEPGTDVKEEGQGWYEKIKDFLN